MELAVEGSNSQKSTLYEAFGIHTFRLVQVFVWSCKEVNQVVSRIATYKRRLA
jgi:hypothetical protein